MQMEELQDQRFEHVPGYWWLCQSDCSILYQVEVLKSTAKFQYVIEFSKYYFKYLELYIGSGW